MAILDLYSIPGIKYISLQILNWEHINFLSCHYRDRCIYIDVIKTPARLPSAIAVRLIIYGIEASVDIPNPFAENPIELLPFADEGETIEIISLVHYLYYIHNLEVSSMDSIPLSQPFLLARFAKSYGFF